MEKKNGYDATKFENQRNDMGLLTESAVKHNNCRMSGTFEHNYDT